MDNITKSIVFDLIKSGHCIEMITAELGVSSLDIQNAMQTAARDQTSNILVEQLASRLPALLELSFKQLEHILLNSDSDRRLRAASLIVQAASSLAKLKK